MKIAKFRSRDGLIAGAQRILRCHPHEFTVIPDPNNPHILVDDEGLQCLVAARDRKRKKRHIKAAELHNLGLEARSVGAHDIADEYDRQARELEGR